jgi:hypothetical protein
MQLEFYESLGGATIYTTLDLSSGFWQIEMNNDEKLKTA